MTIRVQDDALGWVAAHTAMYFRRGGAQMSRRMPSSHAEKRDSVNLPRGAGSLLVRPALDDLHAQVNAALAADSAGQPFGARLAVGTGRRGGSLLHARGTKASGGAIARRRSGTARNRIWSGLVRLSPMAIPGNRFFGGPPVAGVVLRTA